MLLPSSTQCTEYSLAIPFLTVDKASIADRQGSHPPPPSPLPPPPPPHLLCYYLSVEQSHDAAAGLSWQLGPTKQQQIVPKGIFTQQPLGPAAARARQQRVL